MRSASHCTLPTVRHRIPSSTISRELTLSRGRVELNRLSSTSRLTLNRTGERTAAVAATGWAPLRSYSTSRCSSSRAMRLSSVCVRPSRSSSTCSRRSEQPPFRHAKPMSLTPPVVCHQPAPNSSGASPWGTALPPQRCRRQPPAVADVPWLAAAWRDGATDAACVGGCDEGARGRGRGVLPRTGQPARADRSAPLRASLRHGKAARAAPGRPYMVCILGWPRSIDRRQGSALPQAACRRPRGVQDGVMTQMLLEVCCAHSAPKGSAVW